VQHDPKRPFRVSNGTLLVQAIGTKFEALHRQNGSSRVAVTQG
jgi:ferric-dicitrate binding protein FerR (iron transport regulator)